MVIIMTVKSVADSGKVMNRLIRIVRYNRKVEQVQSARKVNKAKC